MPTGLGTGGRATGREGGLGIIPPAPGNARSFLSLAERRGGSQAGPGSGQPSPGQGPVHRSIRFSPFFSSTKHLLSFLLGRVWLASPDRQKRSLLPPPVCPPDSIYCICLCSVFRTPGALVLDRLPQPHGFQSLEPAKPPPWTPLITSQSIQSPRPPVHHRTSDTTPGP